MPAAGPERGDAASPLEDDQARWWYGSVPLGVSAHDLGAELREQLVTTDQVRSRRWLAVRAVTAVGGLVAVAAAVVRIAVA